MSFSSARRGHRELRDGTKVLTDNADGCSACRSWFKNGKVHGPVTAIWPGSRLHYFEALKEPRYEDFHIVYLAASRFAFFGNGYTETELDMESNSVWYFDVLKRELELGAEAFAPVESWARRNVKAMPNGSSRQ